MAHISQEMLRKHQCVCVSPAGTNVFACVVTACGRIGNTEPGGESGRRAGQPEGGVSRLAVKYCGVCQLHRDVLGITRLLITLN